jgi:TPR repeat protein
VARCSDSGECKRNAELGWGLKFDNEAESRRWLTEAARRGEVKAMLHLSDLLEPSDWHEALRWTARAAELGNEEAQANLVRATGHRWFDKYFVRIAWRLRKAAVKAGRRKGSGG